MKRNNDTPVQPAHMTVRKAKDKAFVPERLRLMSGLSVAVIILMTGFLAISLPAPSSKGPVSSVQTTYSFPQADASFETEMTALADDPAGYYRAEDVVSLGLPEAGGLTDLQPFGRSMDVLNQVELQKEPIAVVGSDEKVVRYVAASTVNVREQPDTSSKILFSVSTGETLTHIAPTGEWS